VYTGKKVVIGNICSLVFFMHVFIMFFVIKVKKRVFLCFLFANQCFNIYALHPTPRVPPYLWILATPVTMSVSTYWYRYILKMRIVHLWSNSRPNWYCAVLHDVCLGYLFSFIIGLLVHRP